MNKIWHNNLEAFEKKIGYQFKDRTLLSDSLTHPSIEQSRFELLEFIGDRALSLCIGKMLWDNNVSNGKMFYSEKEYAQNFMPMINKSALLQAGVKLDLQKYVMWKGEKEHENTIIQDACEALIGAYFLDAGFEKVYNFVSTTWSKLQFQSFKIADPKSILQNWGNRVNVKIEYKLISQEGPPHKPKYVVRLDVVNYKSIWGTGTSIKDAEKHVAAQFLKENIDNGKK